MSFVKDFVRCRPALYDRVRSLKRKLTRKAAPSFQVLDEFSRKHNGQVNFIQIGANDGLRNDPLRPLIVRDPWQGVLIEPLPTVFPLLQQNYSYLRREGLVFLNAAIVADQGESLVFWTFSEEFLDTQPLEMRLDFLRKASFERDHVAGFLPPGSDAEAILKPVTVPCFSLERVLAEHLPRTPLHLLVIDAEGYEATLIPAIDFSRVNCEAVFFESEHLSGQERQQVFGHLEDQGFRIQQVGLDSLASRSSA